MLISGLQKTTLLDYPGHVAATIFLGGCNFRCPFCHNGELLDGTLINGGLSESEVMAFLKKRSSILEGVCITGGEPTLHTGLEQFIYEIKSLGLLVKLDTNGYRPDVLKALCKKKLIDYAAMDIKSGKSGYAKASGCPELQILKIDESIDWLMNGFVPYEFRTTVVKELHSTSDFEEIGSWLKGCSQYYLQSFEDSTMVLTPGLSACTKEELLSYKTLLSAYIENVSLRGIEL